MAGKTKKSILNGIKNPLETIGDFGDPTGISKGVATSLVDDLGKGGAGDFLEFMGLSNKSSHETSKKSETNEIDIVNFTQIASPEPQKIKEKGEKTEARVEAAVDYHRDIIKSSERISHQESQALSNQIQQIKSELVSLAKSTKILQAEFASVSVEQMPAQVGVYHSHFFEWMLNMLRAARERVESSESWMKAQKGKNSKKGYWGMFKKHGTQFGLSNERSVATQVG